MNSIAFFSQCINPIVARFSSLENTLLGICLPDVTAELRKNNTNLRTNLQDDITNLNTARQTTEYLRR